jgi:DNA mismatch repair ATPase MutL
MDAGAGLRFLGEHERGFWVVMGPTAVHAVDPHALAEVVLHERLRKELLSGSPKRKQLLFPIKLALTEQSFTSLETRLDHFQQLGFEVRLRADRHLQLLAVPVLLEAANPELALKQLVSTIERLEPETELSLKVILPRLACLGAQPRVDEAALLLQEYEARSGASECIHARVLIGDLWIDDILRKLRREPPGAT